MMNIVQQYSPIFQFHPQETSYPLSIEELCKHSVLRSMPDNKIIAEQFIPGELFSKYNDKNNYIDIPSSTYAGGFDSTVPLYCIVDKKEDYTDLQYFLLYAYNPGYNVLGKMYGEHQGDLEHVTIRLIGDRPEYVLFSAHGRKENSWVQWKDVEKNGDSVVVYVARGSHAHYPEARTYIRIAGFASDVTSKHGFHWQPHTIVEVDDYTAWNNFKGGLSSHFTNPPKKNRWYKNELPLTHKNPTFLTRFFLCCL